MKKYETLQAYAETVRQTQILEAILMHGSLSKAAKALSINPSTVHASVKRIERNAAMRGFSPDHDMTQAAPPTHFAKSISTLYDIDEDGNRVPTKQWVKLNSKLNDQLECLREFAEGLGDTVKGGAKKTKKPRIKSAMADYLTVYPLADMHLGMLAWHEETGEDWDLSLAEEALLTAADTLVAKSEPSKYAVVANLGDFFHFDNDERRTRASGAVLDGDGRWSKVVRLGISCLKYFIQKALEKHGEVHVVNSIGNHDDQSALMIPLILEPYYEKEPRVTIESAPRFHHYYHFGKNLLGFHHGHKTKPNTLPMTMINDQRQIFGETEYAHWLTGHIHHESKEFDGVLVESFRTLAAKDVWHHGCGYRALRDIQSITYHREYGECGRNRISYKMIQSMVS